MYQIQNGLILQTSFHNLQQRKLNVVIKAVSKSLESPDNIENKTNRLSIYKEWVLVEKLWGHNGFEPAVIWDKYVIES